MRRDNRRSNNKLLCFIQTTDYKSYTNFHSHNITIFKISKHISAIQNDAVTCQPLTLEHNMKVLSCSAKIIRHKTAYNRLRPPS